MSSKSAEVQKAYQAAINARNNAHCPYSKFKVGAAFKIKNEDHYISGCNVENASYGATICAERGAIMSWVSQMGAQKELEFLVLVTETADAVPCGMCLQVMSEFCDGDFPVYIADTEAIKHTKRLSDFFPSPFAKESLPTV